MDLPRAAFNAEIALRAAAAVVRERLRPRPAGPIHVLLAVVDHFEPQVGRPERRVARVRLEDWLRLYPAMAGRFRDSDGRQPAHGFFYPWDEYDEWEFERLAELCAAGWGEIELHLHHFHDTEQGLREKLRSAAAAYRARGALSRWPDGSAAWAFIHGNWALDNSRSGARGDFCGVNNELDVLRSEGCCADFTFPAWKHTSQPRQLNSIYYARDDPRPKSYDRGIPARAGRSAPEGLLLIPGPLVPYPAPNGRRTPAMEDADLADYRRYHPARLDRCLAAGIHVAGRPDVLFVKLHCHGCTDRSRRMLLEEDLPALFADAGARYNDGQRYRLHHVTAREMFNIVKAIEAGLREDPGALRDWLLPPPHAPG